MSITSPITSAQNHNSRARSKQRASLLLSAAAAALFASAPAYAQLANDALPTQGVVTHGSATIGAPSNSSMTITQSSDRALIDWASFDIGAGASVGFNQTNGSNSVVVNRVNGGAAPSQIAGSLTANGRVVILNANGVTFAGTANVDVGGLVASSGALRDADAFMMGGALDLVNATAGEIIVSAGANIETVGLAAFVGPVVRNNGSIIATAGKVQLGAGEAFVVDLAGDGLLSIGVGANNPLVQNNGTLFADGGRVQLTARQAGALVSQSIHTNILPVTNVTLDGSTIVLSGTVDEGYSNVNVAENIDAVGNVTLNGVHLTGSGKINVDGALTLSVNHGGAVADTRDHTATNWGNDALGVIGAVTGGTTVNFGEGIYLPGLVVNGSGITLNGGGVAKFAFASAVTDSISIFGDNVTVSDFAIDGGVDTDFVQYDWGSVVHRGIFIHNGADNVTVSGNEISNIRTGIIIDGRNVNAIISDNIIDNTKSAISVQYSNGGDAKYSGRVDSSITIVGNSEGDIGNEVGINVHLNGSLNESGQPYGLESKLGTAGLAEQARLIALSAANQSMSVQNLAYTEANRTHVRVSTAGVDGGQGTARTPLATVQAGLNAVVTGGRVQVLGGSYSGTIQITRAVDLRGEGMGSTLFTSGLRISSASDVLLSGFTVSGVGSDSAIIRNSGVLLNLSMDHVRLDGENVDGRHGMNGGQIGGVISITNSAFVNIRGWAVFDTRSGANPDQGSAILSALFEGNVIDNSSGHIAFRHTIAAGGFGSVDILDNVVTNVASSSNNVGAVFKVFGGSTVNFSDNSVSDVGILQPGGTPPYGSVFSVSHSDFLNVTNNVFRNNNQVFALPGGKALPGVTTFTGNRFVNNGVAIVVPLTTIDGGTIIFGEGNAFVSGEDTVAHILWGSSGAVDLTAVTFDGKLASAMSLAEKLALEDLIYHAMDFDGIGLARVSAGELFVTSSSGSVHRGVAAAQAGDVLYVGNGTYDFGAKQMILSRSIDLIGQSEAGVIFDGRKVNQNGLGTIGVYADDTSLSGFTLLGSTLVGGNYGIKVQPIPQSYNANQRIHNISIRDVTVQGSRRAEFDINGAIGVSLTDITANGYAYGADPAVGTEGAGIQITDSSIITLTGVTTLGNNWGSVALNQTNRTGGYNGQTTDITIDAATNSFSETIGLFTQLESTTQHFGTLNLTGFEYAVRNTGHRPDGAQFTFFRTTLADAASFATTVLPAVNTSSIEGFIDGAFTNVFSVAEGMLIDVALRDVRAGGTVNIGAGTFVQTGAIMVSKSVSITGAGIGETIIDSSAINTWAFNVRSDNVSLAEFSVLGPTGNASSAFGIKVEDNDADLRNNNFSITNVAISGSRRTGLDLNGAVGAVIDGVHVTGVLAGNGISITDSANIIVRNSTTEGNAWGGLALYQANRSGDQQLTNITIEANNDFAEPYGLYLQAYSPIHEPGLLTISGFDYTVRNAAHRSGGEQYTFFQTTAAKALDLAVNLLEADVSIVQSWSGTANVGSYLVGVGNLAGGGVQSMSIQAAFDASAAGDRIDVNAGSYEELLTLDSARILSFGGVAVSGLAVSGVGTSLSGTLTSTGTIDFVGALILNGATNLGATGALTIANVSGDHALTATGGSISLAGGSLASLTLSGGNIAIGSIETSGGQSYSGATTLNGVYNATAFSVLGDATLGGTTSVTTAGGDVLFGGVVGTGSLSISGSNASLGAVNISGALAVDAAQSVLNGASYRASSITFTGANGTVRVTQGLTNFEAISGGSISVISHLIGTTSGQQSVAFSSHDSQTDTYGDILLGNVGSDALRIGGMYVDGDNFNAATVKLAGDFVSILRGNQIFSANTLDTLSNVSANVGGIDSGPVMAGGGVSIASNGSGTGSIVAGGPVTLNYSGDVTRDVKSAGGVSLSAGGAIGGSIAGTEVSVAGGSGAISAAISGTGPVSVSSTRGAITGAIQATGPVTIASTTGSITSAVASSGAVSLSSTSGAIDALVEAGGATTLSSVTGAVNASVTGAGVISITTGGSITGSYTTPAAISLTAGQAVDVTVTSPTVSLSAPSGSVAGNFGQISTSGGGTILVNDAPVIAGSTADSRQVIIDSFLTPVGILVGEDGAFILPAGIAVGLIAPGASSGVQRPPILVNSVSELGALLGKGYTAIIIQIDDDEEQVQELTTGK